jgi:hypothetical protein
MKFLLILTSLTLLAFQPVTAQKKKSLRDSTTVIIFNTSETKAKKKKASGESNIIKISPLGLLSGTFPLTFERRITDFFSLQVSGGITSKNYSRALFASNEDAKITYSYPWSDENTEDVSESLYKFSYRKAKLGYMASVQPRIYFESEGLEGPFLGLSFDYYRYNFDIPGMANEPFDGYKQSGPMKEEHENILDYMVHFGTQTLHDRISLEYSFAVGMRSVKGYKYVARYEPLGGLSDGYATYKQNLLNFNVGFKVGYHF